MATETLTHGALPRLQWSPVITGVLCALAAQIVLGLFGVAFGFAAASAGRALGVLADVWGLVTPLVASCIGAHVAVRMTGEQRDASVYLHGAVVWCIGLIAGAIFINTGKSAVEVTGAAGVAALLGLGGALLGAATGKRAMSSWGQDARLGGRRARVTACAKTPCRSPAWRTVSRAGVSRRARLPG